MDIDIGGMIVRINTIKEKDVNDNVCAVLSAIF